MSSSQGSYSIVSFAGPINYLAETGGWRRIDNTLVPSDRHGYEFENRAHAYKLLLPKYPGAQPLRFEYDGAWITFALEGAISDATPTIRTTSERVDAMPGVDVRWTAGSQGVKEDIILAGPESPRSFTFAVRTSPGLSARLAEDGGIDFVRTDGVRAFSFAAPYMQDSSGMPAETSWAVTYGLTKTEAGYAVSVTADDEWLNDPARVWPVTIDPTIPLEHPDDCHIASGQWAANSHCALTDLKVGYGAGDNSKRRMLLKFPLDPELLQGPRTVTGATLWLWCEGGSTSNGADIQIRRVTTGWTNATSWNAGSPWQTAGGDFGSTNIALRSDTNCGATGWKAWQTAATLTLTDLVQWWADGYYPNHGLLLKQAGETTNNILTVTSTNDASDDHWPYLNVQFSNTAPTVPNELTPISPSWDLDTTPTLSGVYEDVDEGDEGYLLFRICDEMPSTESASCPPGSHVASGVGSGATPGGVSVWSAPALSPGGTYYWQAQAHDGVVSNNSNTARWSEPHTHHVALEPPAPAAPLDESVMPLADPNVLFEVGEDRWIEAELATSPVFGTESIVCSTGWSDNGSAEMHTWDLESCDLAQGVRYWWRGRAADGNPSTSPAPNISAWGSPVWFDAGIGLEDPELADMAASTYADEYNVSVGEADARIADQDRMALADDEIESVLDSYYAGSWFADDGTPTIGVVPPGDIDEALDVVAAYGVTGDVDFVEAASSYDDLMAAADLVDADLVASANGLPFQMGVNEVENRIDVVMSADLTVQHRSNLSQQLAAHGVDVALTYDESAALYRTLTACRAPYCDRPLRGGVLYHGDPVPAAKGAGCTTGFMVGRRSNDELAVLTAGHCIYSDPFDVRSSYRSNHRTHWGIGTSADANITPYDAGLLKVATSSYWYADPWRGWVLLAPREHSPEQVKDYAMTSVGTNARRAKYGQIVCATSGPPLPNGRYSGCGRVQWPDFTIPAEDFGGIRVRHTVMVKMCNHLVGGSSGGPWFKHHRAYGISIATNLVCQNFYQKIGVALDVTDTYLLLE